MMVLDQAITRPLVLAFAIPFPLVHIILGLANLGMLTTIFPALLAMLICVLLMALFVLPCPEGKMASIPAWAIMLGTTAMTVLVNLALPNGVHPGYAAWYSGALQMLLVALVLRQRVALAWAGIIAFLVVQSIGSTLQGMSMLDAVVLMATPLAWVIIATVVNSMLQRSRRAVEASVRQKQSAQAQIAHEYATQVARGQWAAELEQRTRPALEHIVHGVPSRVDRRNFLLLEAELRDTIRGRCLILEGVAAASREARGRGVRVELLDDLKVPLAIAIAHDVASQIQGALSRAQGGFVNVRATRVGTEQLVRIVAFDENHPEAELTVEIGTATAQGSIR